jgi:hypothetical protein
MRFLGAGAKLFVFMDIQASFSSFPQRFFVFIDI